MSDLIDREEAIKAVYDKDIGMLTQWDIGRNAGIDYAIKQLEKLPSAQPEPKKGEWVEANIDSRYVTCSCCKENNIKGRMAYTPAYAATLNYCPNCGADMRGE